MSSSNPANLADEADFRAFTQEVLTDCIRRLQSESVTVRVPQSHGLFRLMDQMPFHLRAELFVQLSGKTYFEFPEEKFEVGPGEICIVPRGMPHRERVRAWKGPFHNLVFTCHGRTVYFHIACEHSQGQPTVLFVSKAQATPSLSSLLEEACELSPHRQACLLAAYFSLILAQMEGWTASTKHEPYKVTHARHIISERLSDPELSVAGLARQLQCSADYLSQIFREATGLPLSAYINESRLLRARELLELSTLNIAEVSQAAGFSDPSYFSRIFRRWHGTTPLEYRQEHT